MKKYFIGAIASIALITSAFTFKSVKRSDSKKQVSLYWFVGSTYTGRQNTRPNEVPISGCPDAGALHCEDGYDANDFKTTGVPTSGLKVGATINDFIRKP